MRTQNNHHNRSRSIVARSKYRTVGDTLKTIEGNQNGIVKGKRCESNEQQGEQYECQTTNSCRNGNTRKRNRKAKKLIGEEVEGKHEERGEVKRKQHIDYDDDIDKKRKMKKKKTKKK